MSNQQKKKKILSQTKNIQIGKGLDMGTAFIYCAQKQGPQVTFKTQRNAFFDIEANEFVRNILKKSNVEYIQSGSNVYVVGEDAMKFANIFGKGTRRPLKNGVISPEEGDALPMTELLIKSVLGPPFKEGELCYYSVPGPPVDADFNTIYHQNIIKGFLEKCRYIPKSINEGLAVIFSELVEDNFTGLGISLGGGLANVCLAVMSVPVFSFSVAKAGDWIDAQVARVTNQAISKVATFKEAHLNLKKLEKRMDKTEQALSIYYNYLIEYVLGEIKKEINRNIGIPKFEKPIPIVVSGGTATPAGFLERFKEIFEKGSFPLEVGELRLATEPLYTVAKGTLIAAIADSKRNR